MKPTTCVECGDPMDGRLLSGQRKYCSLRCRQRVIDRNRKRRRHDKWAWLDDLVSKTKQRLAHRNQGSMNRLNKLAQTVSEPKDELDVEVRGYTFGGVRQRRPADHFVVDPKDVR